MFKKNAEDKRTMYFYIFLCLKFRYSVSVVTIIIITITTMKNKCQIIDVVITPTN